MSQTDTIAFHPPTKAAACSPVGSSRAMSPVVRRREIVALLSVAMLRLAASSKLSKESGTRLEVAGTGASDDLPGESGNYHKENEL